MYKIFIDNDITWEWNRINPCKSSNHLYYRVIEFFGINNYILVDNYKEADYILINTCSIDPRLEKIYKSRILKYRDNNVKSINLIWCWALKKNDLLSLFDNIISVGEEDKLNDLYPNIKIKFKDINRFNIWKQFNSDYNDGFYHIEISKGCLYNCSYCRIKDGIWSVKSRDIESIKEEIKFALDNWYTTINLISDEFWGYWLDIKKDFVFLLKEIFSVSNNFKVILSNVNPTLFVRKFEYIYPYLNRISEIEIPIQHFSDRLLKLMKRTYSVNKVLDMVEKIKNINQSINISTHIIFSYPTETREEFMNIFNKKYYNLFNSIVLNEYVNSKNEFDPKYHIIWKEKLFRRKFVLAICKKYGKYQQFFEEENNDYVDLYCKTRN